MAEDFEIVDGVLIKYHGSDEHVIIPDGVREIGERAFKSCKCIVSVTIPDSVTKIGTGAFESCWSLTNVTIPCSLTKIGEWAFYDCTSLTSVTIPDSVIEIGGFTFAGCTSLTSVTIKCSVTEIRHDTFYDCKSLTSVTIPNSLRIIGNEAFYCCTSISSVKIPDSVAEIGKLAFYGCKSLISVTIPDSVTRINVGAFSDCLLLRVVCSEGSCAHQYCEEERIAFIFDYQFEAFHGLVPPGIEKLSSPFTADEDNPFVFISYSHKDRDKILPILKHLYEKGWKIWYDEGLTIGDKYDEVLEKHIKNCSAFLLFVTKNSVNSFYIKEHEIPWAQQYEKPIVKCILNKGIDYETDEGSITSTVAENGIEDALENIQGLAKGEKRMAKGISVVVNPNERGEKDGNNLAYCVYSEKSSAKAKSILLEAKSSGCKIYDAVQNGDDDEKLRTCACLLVLVDKAFIYDEHLMELLIGEFTLGKDIAACQIEEIVESDMPDELIELHRRHWLDFAHGITPDMITRLSQYLQKRGCRKAAVLPGFDYEITEKGIVIKRYKGFARELRIEREYGGMPVIEIADRAFENCIHLFSIEIPSSVTKIKDSAFRGCISLIKVNIPDRVTIIASSVFEECKSLSSVIIPNCVTKIGYKAFENCTSLTSVSIPGSVTEIGGFAFAGCTDLTSVIIPCSVTEIGWLAFRGCTSLSSVTIPDGVTAIYSSTFLNCTSLLIVTIPGSVEKIGFRAFEGCTSLNSVTIPDSVTEIGDDAFRGCTSLMSVTIKGRNTEVFDRTFFGCSPDLVICAPRDSYAHEYALANNIRFREL